MYGSQGFAYTEQGPQGRDVYQAYASGLFLFFALLGDGTGLVIALGVAVNYLHYIASSAHQLALTSVLPFAASMLLCCSLIAVLSWAQSVELRLPITFYRTRSNHVRVTLNATMSTSAPHAATYCRGAITELQVQQEHPLIQALCKRDVQHRDRTVEFALDGNNEQHLLMRLSPSGARSLLFANFWAALLQTPLSWVGIASPFDHAWGFAALVFLTEAVTVFDTMPRQMSRFLATVS
ncbi:hypothetical protein ACK3TF_005092 [Chlorella vulgaris]